MPVLSNWNNATFVTDFGEICGVADPAGGYDQQASMPISYAIGNDILKNKELHILVGF